VTILHSYGQKGELRVRFRRLLAVWWPGAQNRIKNKVLLDSRTRTEFTGIILRTMMIKFKKSLCSASYTYADNVALPAFAPAAALLIAVQQSIGIACRPGLRVCCCGPMLGQTDNQRDNRMDAQQMH